MRYRLEGKTVVREEDLMTWARWLETADVRVAFTTLDDCEISTVFLGLDYDCPLTHREGPPLSVFETMVFGGHHDGYQRRWAIWEEAEEGHEEVVAMVRGCGEVTVMDEWGYLLAHLNDRRYIAYSKFREQLIRAEIGEVAHKGAEVRVPLLVDIAIAAMEYAGDGHELDRALVKAGYLPEGFV